MQQIKLSNQSLEVVINLIGAEVRSVKNRVTGHEYMWNANTDIWAGVSPVLFPVVGKTTNGELKFAGKSYPQGNHGFARSSLFKVIAQSDTDVTLQIITAELGAEVYPFNLAFKVRYSLDKSQLITEYTVSNLDHQRAYFSVGAHPAFKCPFDDKHLITDYVIEFSEPEPNLKLHEITPQAFFTGKIENLNFQKLDLKADTFANDALIYENYSSSHITLREKDSNRQICVSLSGFPWLGLWSKVGADYVCIEPWCGHSDMLGFNGDINDKSAIEDVEPGMEWSRRYSIEYGY